MKLSKYRLEYPKVFDFDNLKQVEVTITDLSELILFNGLCTPLLKYTLVFKQDNDYVNVPLYFGKVDTDENHGKVKGTTDNDNCNYFTVGTITCTSDNKLLAFEIDRIIISIKKVVSKLSKQIINLLNDINVKINHSLLLQAKLILTSKDVSYQFDHNDPVVLISKGWVDTVFNTESAYNALFNDIGYSNNCNNYDKALTVFHTLFKHHETDFLFKEIEDDIK